MESNKRRKLNHPEEITIYEETKNEESLNDESIDNESSNEENLNDESINEESSNEENLNDFVAYDFEDLEYIEDIDNIHVSDYKYGDFEKYQEVNDYTADYGENEEGDYENW